MPNIGSKTSRILALNLDHFRIDRGEVVFVLGMRGAGKSALHDVIESIFHLSESESDNITIPQCKQDKPSVEVAKLWRAFDCRFHSQSGKVTDVPDTNEKVLLYCDDPTNEGTPTGPGIIDRALERKHTMLIGTDPDRLEVTLRHFSQRNTGRILWLHEGKRYFEGNNKEFHDRRNNLCASLQPKDPSDWKFLNAVLNVGDFS